MNSLDLSALTDDQLIGLIRACLREAVARNPAVHAAMRAAVVDEAEAAQIAVEATEREAAKIRALQRERIAREAAERMRREYEAQEAVAAKFAAKRAGEEAAAAGAAKLRAEMDWLARIASLVGGRPGELSLLFLYTKSGRRVILNQGGDNRYGKDHLVDWRAADNAIKTAGHLVPAKPKLVQFCAEFHAAHRANGEAILLGKDYNWATYQEEFHHGS